MGQMINVYHIAMFKGAGVNAAAARALHSELLLDLVTNSISSNNMLSERGDIGATRPLCNASLSGAVESSEP